MEYVERGLAIIADFAPRLILFLVILLIGWIVAKALSKALAKVLERVGFDRAVERGGLSRATGSSTPSGLVALLLYYAILLIALQIAFGVFGENPVSDLLTQFVAFLPRIFVAILIVVIAAAIAKAVKDIVGGALGGATYGSALATGASVFVLALGIIAALNQIGVAQLVTGTLLIATLATIAGILVVGVGGGLVMPMARRWEGWLDKAQSESRNVAQQARSSAEQSEPRTTTVRTTSSPSDVETQRIPTVSDPRD